MQRLELKATHKPVQNYYAALRQFDDLGVTHETAVRSAFQGLLDHCARQHDWTLVPEWEIRRPRQLPLRVDGALLDNFRLTHGFWEAKDSRDDLPKEARKKFDLGYPRDSINVKITWGVDRQGVADPCGLARSTGLARGGDTAHRCCSPNGPELANLLPGCRIIRRTSVLALKSSRLSRFADPIDRWCIPAAQWAW